MAALSNPKHERFAQEIAAGKSAAEAYGIAGFKPNRHNAAALARQQHVITRRDEILARREMVETKSTQKAIERAAIDKAWVLTRLQDVAERCMTVEPVTDNDGEPIGEYTFQAAGANKALELIGKHLQMFPREAPNVNVHISLETLIAGSFKVEA